MGRLDVLRVNPTRLREDFEALAAIGSTGDGGVHRPALSEAHLAAREWFRQRAQRGGLAARVDGAGNHSAFLGCGPSGAPALLLGSHLDSVPYGGRFDGPLGVVAALEVLQVVAEAGLSLPVNLEAIDFTDEEGTLISLLGSLALAGKLGLADLQSPRGGRQGLLAGMRRAGLSDESFLTARREPGSLAGYLELHIEQGPRLVQAGAAIGIVTGLVGSCSYELTYWGRADHAGTTSMRDRLDAAQGAAAFTLAVREAVLADFPGCVANVGAITLSPGAFNIVPAKATLWLELRTPEAGQMEQLEARLLADAHLAAERFGLRLEVEMKGKHPPTLMDQGVQDAIRSACLQLGVKWVDLFSGAWHDAQSLAGICPVGMLFVPSQDGASHSPREFTTWDDCLTGANVLLHAALRLAMDQV
jgi:hydantoinase/carbamoylase family amidase